MENKASSGRKKYRSLNYRKTIICARSLFISFSCFFGLYCVLLLFLHTGIQYDEYSAGVNSPLRALERFSNEGEGAKSLFRLKKNGESQGAGLSIHSNDFHSIINGNSTSYFGFVMSEFACRVLSRHITSSNILVVAPDAVVDARDTIELLTTRELNTRNDLHRVQSVGSSFLRYGASEGHTIHAINSDLKDKSKKRKAGPTLDAWWKSFDTGKMSYDVSKQWWSPELVEKPSWILLAVFDSNFGLENSVWQESEAFLQECTVTYFVIAVHSIKRDDGSYKFGGMDAIRSLLKRKYKVQTLSSSHYYAEKNEEREIFEKYGPNALFQSAEEFESFLRWGADAAQGYGNTDNSVFSSYIFATQGLDLAIPAPQVYLRDESLAIDVFNKRSMEKLPPLKMCHDANGEKLEFVFNKTSLQWNLSKNKSVSYSHDDLGKNFDEDVTIWMDGTSLSQSEAVCLKHKNGLSKCNTRVSKKQLSSHSSSSRSSVRPNLLLILLDPISRPHFDRSMPKTGTTLEKLNFTRFEKYTAIGPNSGPNQAALYSGTTLKKRNLLQKDFKNNDKWLWDRLRLAGYVTLKGEDSCIENSNMMQSLEPNTTHGSALQGLFCFDDFSRPNCIGPDLASSILLEYGHKFVSTYENLRRNTHGDLRWASFLHFVDSHEDTMMLSATVDPGLSKFLLKLSAEGHFKDSVVIVSSDHGLHYGPKFGSWQGRKEATEPILYIHFPDSVQHEIVNVLSSNAHLWTTPFDVHETILELTQTSSSKDGSNRQGLALTEHLPTSRKECETTDLIPSKYCALRDKRFREDDAGEFCKPPLMLPAIDSFFLDLSPKIQRPLMNFDTDCIKSERALTEISKFDICTDQ